MASSLNGTGLTFSSGATLNSPPVTSVAAGNGLTGGTITTTGTISLDFYTGTTALNTSYPIGSYVAGGNGDPTLSANMNQNQALWIGDSGRTIRGSSSSGFSALSGTWRTRGGRWDSCSGYWIPGIFQRTA